MSKQQQRLGDSELAADLYGLFANLKVVFREQNLLEVWKQSFSIKGFWSYLIKCPNVHPKTIFIFNIFKNQEVFFD